MNAPEIEALVSRVMFHHRCSRNAALGLVATWTGKDVEVEGDPEEAWAAACTEMPALDGGEDSGR